MNDRYVLKMLFLFLVFSSLFIIIEAGQDMDWYWYIIYCWTGILHTGLVYYILDWYIIYWTVHYPCSLHVITIGPTKHDITSAIGRLPIKAGKFDTSR